jgi:single-strand DNA-binding protein
MAYNKVIMQGNLTKDNELKYLPSGSAVLSNSVAVTDKWKDQNGQQKEDTCFLEFSIFGKGAETFNQYTHKGSKVLLDGKLKLEKWQDQNGNNRQAHKMKVENFTFLDSKDQSQGQQGYGQPQGQYQQPRQQQGYGQPQGQYQQPQQQQYSQPQQQQYQQPQAQQGQPYQQQMPMQNP